MDKKGKLKRGIFLLPTLFTIANLGAGFFSLLASFNQQFIQAAWIIFVAIGLDILDGRIARWTRAYSRFGIELDSLADLISFGLAPSVLMYFLVLNQFKHGEIVSFLFLLAAVLRLARFNTVANQNSSPMDYFVGLPVPGAAGFLSAFVLAHMFLYQEVPQPTTPFVMKNVSLMCKTVPFLMILLSFLMLSKIKYTSFKTLRLTKRVPLRILLIIVVFGLIFCIYPENVIFIVFIIYVLSGLLNLIWKVYRLRRKV